MIVFKVVPVPGAQVAVTLVAPIQRRLQESLQAAVQRHRPTSAAGVVVDPTTGAIVAMASYPDFDLSDWQYTEEIKNNFRNNVLNFVYESGSTMKPLVAGAAVVEGIVNWQSEVFCENGRWTARIGNSRRTISDHSYKYGGHQYLTVSEGVAKSDNILMAKLGIELGPDRLYTWIRRFGFGSRTGLDIGGEDSGVVRPRSKWDVINSCMSVPMGHELSVTPCKWRWRMRQLPTAEFIIHRVWCSALSRRAVVHRRPTRTAVAIAWAKSPCFDARKRLGHSNGNGANHDRWHRQAVAARGLHLGG